MLAIKLVSEGKTPSAACKEVGIPLGRLLHHTKRDFVLEAAYEEAQQVGREHLADMLVNIDQVHSDPSVARIISKNIQWLLERRDRKRYGQTITVEKEGSAGDEIIAALHKAIDRIPMAEPVKVIEHRPFPQIAGGSDV